MVVYTVPTSTLSLHCTESTVTRSVYIVTPQPVDNSVDKLWMTLEPVEKLWISCG